MIQKEDLKALDQAVDKVIGRLSSMSLEELRKKKTKWEERICNDAVESPCQEPRLKILREVIKEIKRRR